VNRADAINERMKSILEDYGLSNRLVYKYEDNLLEDIDINKIDTFSQQIVGYSRKWLNSDHIF
jgi:hypothetical protein